MLAKGAGFAIGVPLFFFQAEDGIRDLVRSRGLGDVYKRQLANNLKDRLGVFSFYIDGLHHDLGVKMFNDRYGTVSYTHLTLPTSDLV